MNAASWFYSQSFHSHAKEPKPERTGPKVGELTTVDRWDAERNCWREVTLRWDGVAYVEFEEGR